MKKADADRALAQLLAEQEASRDETIDEMNRVTERTRDELRHRIAVVSLELDEARDGVVYLSNLINRLLTTRPLIATAHNRGLSIAARTVADTSARRRYADLSGSLVGAEQELPAVCAQYGALSGGYVGVAALLGHPRTARETVFEMLLSLADRKLRRSRHALLDPRAAMAGCAWRKKHGDPVVGCDTVTVVVVASHFSELTVIAERGHLNIDVLRREVPSACAIARPRGLLDAPLASSSSSNSNSTGGAPAPHLTTTVLRTTRASPDDPSGALVHAAELVSPVAQPAVCGNEADLYLRCGPNAAVCAVLLPERDGADSMTSVPQFAPGEQLVQRDPSTGLVRVRVKLPAPGRHVVGVFVRDGTDVFRRVAVAAFDAQRYDPRDAWRRFPVLSSDFADRNGYLLEPLDGVLAPDSEVAFRVSLPVSAHYKGREKQRVARLVDEAQGQDAACRAAIEAVQPRLADAKAALAAAESTKDAAVAAAVAEMAALQKDLLRRKAGKEHDRLKLAVAESEARVAHIHASVAAKRRAVEHLDEELAGYLRTRQQSAAMMVRYAEEQSILAQCTDRSRPLLVELATDERRATLAPQDAGSEVYSARIRTPGAGGHVSLFVGGALAILFDVLPPPPHFLTSCTAQPLRLE